MKGTSQKKMLILGALVACGSSMTAWAVRYDGRLAEPAPMEGVLAEAEAAGAAAVSWDLPVTRNERVDQWIGFLSKGNADKTRLWLERSGRYREMIHAELRARGMPEDLIYLAFIESGFSPKAYSRASASGMWQFMEETGERYGLEVNGYVDERRDPIEATGAALTYLQELHDQFGSWYLAAAAYNSGENRVQRVLRERVGGRTGDEELFWRIAAHLPRETRDYVPLMLAAGHIGKEPEKYGFTDVQYQAPLAFDTAWVPSQSLLELVAQAAGVDKTAVEDLNPHLVRGVTPPGRGWAVRIPAGSQPAFAQNFAPLYRSATLARAEAEKVARASAIVAAASGRRHTIKRGETLSGVAKRYDVSVSALLAANNNISARRLQPGQTIKVPGRSGGATVAVASKSTSASAKTASARSRIHLVKRGESLSRIADRYDVTISRLRSLNKLGSRSTIVPGQKLRIT